MTDGIARRRFLTQLTCALSVTATGGSLAWWASAAAQPPQRKTPSGDLLETVPRGELPSFAKKGGPTVEAVYRYAVAHGELHSPSRTTPGPMTYDMHPSRSLEHRSKPSTPPQVREFVRRIHHCAVDEG
jgi:hypothetical protein